MHACIHAYLDVQVHELVLVKNLEPQERLPQEGVDAVDLEAVSALELLLQGRLAQLRLDVQPLVLDPRLAVMSTRSWSPSAMGHCR